MDSFKKFGEIAIGSRLKRLSDYMMKETQLVYDAYNIDFDPFLFPTFKIIISKNGVTNTEITESLQVTQPATTQAVNKLISKKLIILKNDKSDGRKKIIHLSKKGKELVQKTTPIWKCIEETIKEITTQNSTSLVEHITLIEEKFEQQKFSDTIIKRYEQNINKAKNDY